jgi:cell division protein FtsI/penicillin-binding protein 2
LVRRRAGAPEGQQTLGRVGRGRGGGIGIDGYEKTHDELLRGRPGIFRVRTGADGRWLMDTWEKVQEMQPGYDVILPWRSQQ